MQCKRGRESIGIMVFDYESLTAIDSRPHPSLAGRSQLHGHRPVSVLLRPPLNETTARDPPAKHFRMSFLVERANSENRLRKTIAPCRIKLDVDFKRRDSFATDPGNPQQLENIRSGLTDFQVHDSIGPPVFERAVLQTF